MTRILMFGPPGVGKGTQGAVLAAALGVPAVSTGDLFRDHIRRGTDLGLRTQALIAAGDYVPDAITNGMLAERLALPDAAAGFLLDGYPRTPEQVDELDRLLASAETALDAVLLLEAPDDELMTRLRKRAAQDGRTDDTPEVIRHRLELYRRETAPLAAAYERRGLLHRVDGVGSTAEVHGRLAAVLPQPTSPA